MNDHATYRPPRLALIPPQVAMIETDRPRNLLQGGIGGGKTFTAGDVLGMFISNIPSALGLLAANTYGQLSDSTVVRVMAVLKERFGYIEDVHYVIDKKPPGHYKPHGYIFKNNFNKIFWVNGAVTMLASLDNYKALDGREVAYAILDETKDTKEAAVKEVIIGRLRQKTVRLLNEDSTYSRFRFCGPEHPEAGEEINPLFVFTSPAKEQWLTQFFRLDDEECREGFNRVKGSDVEYFQRKTATRNVVIYSTELNRPNLPSGYIEALVEDLSEDQIDLLIHGSPYGKTGGEYYASYKRNITVKPCQPVDRFPVHLSFDFNVNPYMPGIVGQMIPNGDRYLVTIFKEYALKHPRNSIDAVCEDFLVDFYGLLKYGLYYYGDASGKNSLPIADYKNYFAVVRSKLRQYISESSKRLLKQNPRHKTVYRNSLGRRDFMNKILRGGYKVDLVIDPSCKLLIADLEHLKEDKNGAKKKEKVTEHGVTFEKYGHHSDALDAFICYNFGHYAKDK